jgi:mannose-6-phosphate isomerase-like protein (cupin superfamily)
MEFARGTLISPALAPERGETVHSLVRVGGARIDVILSGVLDAPVDYAGDDDEWFVLLDGTAELAVAGEVVSLGPGDWMVLPRGTRHRLVHTGPGTRWLTVHAHGEGH